MHIDTNNFEVTTVIGTIGFLISVFIVPMGWIIFNSLNKRVIRNEKTLIKHIEKTNDFRVSIVESLAEIKRDVKFLINGKYKK